MTLSTTNLIKSAQGSYQEDISKLTDLDLLASSMNAMLWSGIKTQAKEKQDLVNIATVAVVQLKNDFYFAFNDHNLDVRKQYQNPDIGKLSKDNPPELAVVTKIQSESPASSGQVSGTYANATKNSVDLTTEVVAIDTKLKVLVTRKLTKKFSNGDVIFSPAEALKSLLWSILKDDLIAGTLGTAINKLVVLTPSTEATQHAEMRLLSYLKANNTAFGEIGVSKPCCHRCADALDQAGIKFTRWSIVKGMRGWLAPAEIMNTIAQTV